MDLESRDTITIYEVYTITGDFTMGTERSELFMREKVASEFFNDLIEEVIEDRRDKIEKLEKKLDEGDFTEPPEDIQYGEEDWIKEQIEQMKEDIEMLQSDDYPEKKIPITSHGNEFPLKASREVVE